MTFQNPERLKNIIRNLLPKLLKCERRRGIFRGFRKNIQFYQKQLQEILEALNRGEAIPTPREIKEVIQDAASLISAVNKMRSQEKKANSLKMYMRIVEKEMTPIFTLSLDGVIIYANPAALRTVAHLRTQQPLHSITIDATTEKRFFILGTKYNDLLQQLFENDILDVIKKLNTENEIPPGTIKGCVYKMEKYYDIIGLKNEFQLPSGNKVEFMQSRWIDITSVERAIRKMIDRFGPKNDEDIDDLVEILLNHEKRALLALADLEELRDVEITGPHIMTVYECTKFYGSLLMDYLDQHPDVKQDSGYQLPDGFSAENFAIAATLHDIGKVTTPDQVLRKPGKFKEDEWEIMKLHTLAGAYIIEELKKNEKKTPLYTMAKRIAMSHHEKWSGGSYPQGLRSIEIPIEARITAIFDVFDALLTDRHYKKSWTIEEVRELFHADLERSDDDPLKEFDTLLLSIFLEHFDRFVELKYTVERDYRTKTEAIRSSDWLNKTVNYFARERERWLREESFSKRTE